MNVTNAQTMDFKNPFDSWKSIVISLYMTLIGYGVLVGIPVISTAWVTLLGFSEVEVGRVAGVESINPSLPRYQRHPTAFALYCKLYCISPVL